MRSLKNYETQNFRFLATTAKSYIVTKSLRFLPFSSVASSSNDQNLSVFPSFWPLASHIFHMEFLAKRSCKKRSEITKFVSQNHFQSIFQQFYKTRKEIKVFFDCIFYISLELSPLPHFFFYSISNNSLIKNSNQNFPTELQKTTQNRKTMKLLWCCKISLITFHCNFDCSTKFSNKNSAI